MAKQAKNMKIPQTDSIRELAEFWDTHDLTDFDDQMEEVGEPVFERKRVVSVELDQKEIEAVNEMAKSTGLGFTDLIRKWILEKIHAS